MGFYAGDTYQFVLNIPTVSGTPTVTSPPLITIIDLSNPGSPIVTGVAMTLVTGTSFIYRYAFAIPAASPKDYVAIYSYAVSNSQSLSTATLAQWGAGISSYKFGLPLPVNAVPGSKLTTLGFTPSGFNITAQTILNVTSAGVVTVAKVSNPGTIESFNLAGNAQIIAGIPNVGTAQLTQITNGQISPGDSITIASATTSALNGVWTVNTAILSLGVWTVTFYTTGTPFSSAAQSAGTATNANVSLATVNGTGSAITSTTVSNQLITRGDILHVGDSYITGQVALDSTVAQNATVAKDATVFKTTSYVSPTNDTTIQAINSAVSTILTNSNTTSALLGSLDAGTLSGLLQDVYDNLFGSWSIDQTQNPPILYINRIDGVQIASFQLINNGTVTQRTVLSNPPESNI